MRLRLLLSRLHDPVCAIVVAAIIIYCCCCCCGGCRERERDCVSEFCGWCFAAHNCESIHSHSIYKKSFTPSIISVVCLFRCWNQRTSYEHTFGVLTHFFFVSLARKTEQIIISKSITSIRQENVHNTEKNSSPPSVYLVEIVPRH